MTLIDAAFCLANISRRAASRFSAAVRRRGPTRRARTSSTRVLLALEIEACCRSPGARRARARERRLRLGVLRAPFSRIDAARRRRRRPPRAEGLISASKSCDTCSASSSREASPSPSTVSASASAAAASFTVLHRRHLGARSRLQRRALRASFSRASSSEDASVASDVQRLRRAPRVSGRASEAMSDVRDLLGPWLDAAPHFFVPRARTKKTYVEEVRSSRRGASSRVHSCPLSRLSVVSVESGGDGHDATAGSGAARHARRFLEFTRPQGVPMAGRA